MLIEMKRRARPFNFLYAVTIVLTIVTGAVIAVPAGAAPGAVQATTPNPEAATSQDEGERIAYAPEEIARLHAKLSREIMSPFCAGLTLANCPTSGAARMRDDILGWLQEGRSESWILDRLVETWGESVLGAPRFSGIGLVAWLAPALALIAGGVFLAVYLRNTRFESDDVIEAEADTPEPSDPTRQALLERIDRELEEHLS